MCAHGIGAGIERPASSQSRLASRHASTPARQQLVKGYYCLWSRGPRWRLPSPRRGAHCHVCRRVLTLGPGPVFCSDTPHAARCSLLSAQCFLLIVLCPPEFTSVASSVCSAPLRCSSSYLGPPPSPLSALHSSSSPLVCCPFAPLACCPRPSSPSPNPSIAVTSSAWHNPPGPVNVVVVSVLVVICAAILGARFTTPAQARFEHDPLPQAPPPAITRGLSHTSTPLLPPAPARLLHCLTANTPCSFTSAHCAPPLNSWLSPPTSPSAPSRLPWPNGPLLGWHSASRLPYSIVNPLAPLHILTPLQYCPSTPRPVLIVIHPPATWTPRAA